MIEETARVVDVKEGQALLETQRKHACQSCSVKSGCGTSTLAKVVGKRSSQFVVDNTLQVKPGDEVVVAIEENALVQGSMLVYLLPLILMLACGLLAEWWFANELLTILSALVGLFVSVGLVRYILAVTTLKHSIRPHLIRRIV